MKTTDKLIVCMSAAALIAGACDPAISGSQGNLDLTYDEGPVAGAGASSPLAVGARLDYSARLSGEGLQNVSFTSAWSSDDGFVRVVGTDGGVMTLEGMGDGEAAIDVDATGPDGEAVDDVFDIEAATVDALEFDHPCAPGDEALYLVDHDVRLHYTMRADGTIAVGYGHYPVEIAPEQGASVGESTINGLLPLRTGSTPGEVTVSSTVDDAEFTINLIEEGDIDGISIFEKEFVNEESNLPVGVDMIIGYHLLPTVSGLRAESDEPVPVCQTDVDVEVESNTPDICGVSYQSSPANYGGAFDLYETNLLGIEGEGVGTCEISVTIPGASGGDGVQETFEIEVVERR